NVMSYHSNNEAFVWATQWQSGEVIANADVEMLFLGADRTLKVIGRGKTDSSGVAKFNFDSTHIADRDSITLVRVKGGGKVVVAPTFARYGAQMPFDSHRNQSYRYRSDSDESSQRIFGVTELPLYRPGEAVNYRIWMRQRNANHLQSVWADKKVEIGFIDSNEDKILQTWEAQLDANASFAGSLPLSRLLPDGLYCIGSNSLETREGNGACFQVARFETQPLWATLKADRVSLLAGQSLKFNLESGYFSGGPAAKIDLKYSGVNTVRRFDEAYPQFNQYEFANPFDTSDMDELDAGSPFNGKVLPKKTDAKGKAEFEISFRDPLKLQDEKVDIPFALMEFSVEVKIPGKASAGSNSLAVNYSKYPKFIGLKTKEWWLRQDKDPGLEAVVVSYEGKEITGETVNVTVFKLLKDQKEVQVGTCTLISGQKSSCDFRASEPGRYAFKAAAKDSAETQLVRYIGKPSLSSDEEEKPDASLRLLKASDGATPARVLLIQPYENATALFTLEYDHIVHHWSQTLNSKEAEIDIPVKAEWAPGLSLRVIVRPAANGSAKQAMSIKTLDATLDILIPRIMDKAVTVKALKPQFQPGEEVELEIHNPGNSQRFATLSVLDDSVYQQASGIWEYQDPAAKEWLGVLSNWSVQSWYGLETLGDIDNIFGTEIEAVEVVGSRIKRVDAEVAQPIQVMTRADVQKTGLNNVFDILNTIKASDGSGLSTVNTYGSKEIEAVRLTGSRITAADIFVRTPNNVLIFDRAKNNPGKPMPRVRNQ
ncbi:MAG: MG2 domain-containing protein, partial [Arenimonas sp.]